MAPAPSARLLTARAPLLLVALAAPRLCGALVLGEGPAAPAPAAPGQGESCHALKREGKRYNAVIEVGTPPQRFDAALDTSVLNVLVTSCLCVDEKTCPNNTKCFRGTNKSSTFSSINLPDEKGKPLSTKTAFDGGLIDSMLSSDVVHIGRRAVSLDGALLLMVDYAKPLAEEDEVSDVDAILGLGLPPAPIDQTQFEKLSSQDKIRRRANRGFLETAGVRSFSVCLGPGEDSGVLRFDEPYRASRLQLVGKVHWGIAFHGISFDGQPQSVSFCSQMEMAPGQLTPCGAIPDPSVTLLMGGDAQLKLLFSDLCDNWERCASQTLESRKSKLQLFTETLTDCESWLGKGQGLEELPNLHFHMKGQDGSADTLVLSPSSYVIQTTQKEVVHVKKALGDVFDLKADIPTGRKRKVCAPAFGKHDFRTQANGEVWIFGAPIFREFRVIHDRHDPPALAFEGKACGSCADEGAPGAPANETALFSKQRRYGLASNRHKGLMPRTVEGPFQYPTMDLSRGL